MENSLEKIIKLLVKSVLMGTANKLPGISGGLVALITGFYEEMIESFNSDVHFHYHFKVKILPYEPAWQLLPQPLNSPPRNRS